MFIEKLNIKFGETEIKKQKLQQYKIHISIKIKQQRYNSRDKIVDITKIVISNKVSFGKIAFNYFSGYKDASKIIITYIKYIQNLLGYQYITSILFLEQVKTILLKCFQKYLNILPKKKKKMSDYIIDGTEISSGLIKKIF